MPRLPLPEETWPSEAQAATARLFSPLRLGRCCWLRSRTWVPAMVPWRATEEGFVTAELLAWYERFARGRPGALVVEATGIRDVPSGPLLRIGHDRFLGGLARLVEVVRRASGGHTRLFIQLIDFLSIRRRPPPEKYLGSFLTIGPELRERLSVHLEEHRWQTASDEGLRRKLQQLSPQALKQVLSPRQWEDLQFGARERVTDLHLPHIRQLPQVLPGLFAEAARRAERAGFDGVELHYAHAYTMASFLSALNTRTDGYGGNREGRVRLPLEVLRATRAAVSPSFVVGCRLLGDEVIEGGSSLDDVRSFAVALGRAGLDFLSLSKGGKFEDARQPSVGRAAYPYTGPSGAECMPTARLAGGPWGRHRPLGRAVRQTLQAAGLNTPVVLAGGINSFRLAEEILATGDADICAAARQTLADPDWFEKMRTGRGDSIRRCQYTNYCEGLDQSHRPVTCRLWDRDPEAPGPRTADGRLLVAPPEPRV